jgi:hypothetical protein
MESLPPNEIPPPPLARLKPTKEDRALLALPLPPPMEVAQLDEPASLGAGGRDGRGRPTRRRGKVDGVAATRSKEAVPMEKEGSGPRPARPRGGSPPGAGDLGWKATRERPRRPRGGGRRSSSP